MSMINTGTESLPMVLIFIPLADPECTSIKIGLPSRELNTLIVGEKYSQQGTRKEVGVVVGFLLYRVPCNKCCRVFGWIFLFFIICFSLIRA